MVVENFTIADVRSLGNAFAVNESRKWKSDFFKEKVTSDCQTKLRKKRLIQYYNPQTGKVARTALFSRGATGVVCLLEDAKGEKDKYVLKLYERLDENFVERQGIISKTIKDWGNKGIRKYFVDYSYYSQAFQDWSDEEKLGSFLVMEQVQNSKPLAAKYISDLRNQKSTDEFQSILGGIVKEYVNLMKVLSKENVGFGDLSGDNLLVSEKINERDGTVTYILKLVDYDDMYVPGISGFSVEAGKPGFQHKTRVVGWKLTSTIHHFSSLVYYVSLLVCLKDWEFAKNYLSENYADTQTWNILFKGEDLLYPGSSSLFEDIRNHKDKEINFFAGKLYEWACADSVENMPSLPDLIREFETPKPKPEPVPEPIGKTEIPIQPRDEDSNRSGSNKKEVPINPREEELGADELCALGDKYYEGDGVQKDYKKAVEYYTKAAEKGSVWAQHKLAEMYHYGDGVVQDYKKAVKWYAILAKQGDEDAQYELAEMYYYGEGVVQDYEKALVWYKKAVAQGHAMARNGLVQCYEALKEVKINSETAKEGRTKTEKKNNHRSVTTVPDTYTVIYDGNGALDGRMRQETHTCGEARKLQKNHFTRTGYKFLGWANTPDGRRKYDDGEEVRDLGDKNSTVTLYAHWKPIEYKINYVGNGADGNDTLRSIHTYNEEMRLAANIFTRKGYKFLGWATSPSYPVTYRDEDVVINLSNTDNATVNLYAVWEKILIKYTVIYDGNGATEGSMKRETYIQDEVRKLPTNRFVRPGYKFVGWAKTPTGAKKYDDGEAVRNIADGEPVVILYAKWSLEIDDIISNKLLFKIGLSYYEGDIVPKDYKEAFKCWSRAAEHGYTDAQLMVALCYLVGIGVEKDNKKAIEWYNKAAEHDHTATIKKIDGSPDLIKQLADKVFDIGMSYYEGNGVPKDHKKAFECWTTVAKQGHARAQNNIGICYNYGYGVEKDYKKAVEWYTKSAKQGYASAQYNLGECYYHGYGVQKDYVKAVELYKKAADQGLAVAQFVLGGCYEHGHGVEIDIGKAIEWYKKAAEQGDKSSQEALSNLESRNKRNNTLVRLKKLFSKK